MSVNQLLKDANTLFSVAAFCCHIESKDLQEIKSILTS